MVPRPRGSDPQGIAVDGANSVYVADTGNHTIRKITDAGVVMYAGWFGWQSRLERFAWGAVQRSTRACRGRNV